MTEIMTSSQPESHFSRKRSYDDIDDGPGLMNPSSLPSEYNGENQANKQILYAVMDSTQRGSEDHERFSQEEASLPPSSAARESQEERDEDSQTVQQIPSEFRQSRPVVGECRTYSFALDLGNSHLTYCEVLTHSSIVLPASTSDARTPPAAKKPRTTTTSESKAEKEANAAADKARKIAEKEVEKARRDADKAAAKEAERARREAEKAAERQAAVQKKAAEKAARDAEKEAEKSAEKAAKDAAKEAERVAKEAEKAEREAEKAARAKEKAERDAEKAAEKAKKDAEKARKDQEKKQKEESKMKAERSQMRLGNFFSSTAAPKDDTKGTKSLLHSKYSCTLEKSLTDLLQTPPDHP